MEPDARVSIHFRSARASRLARRAGPTATAACQPKRYGPELLLRDKRLPASSRTRAKTGNIFRTPLNSTSVKLPPQVFKYVLVGPSGSRSATPATRYHAGIVRSAAQIPPPEANRTPK